MDDSAGLLPGTLDLLILTVCGLTNTDRARLGNEAASWNRIDGIADAISMTLTATAKEI
jgi:hypothetical protein